MSASNTKGSEFESCWTQKIILGSIIQFSDSTDPYVAVKAVIKGFTERKTDIILGNFDVEFDLEISAIEITSLITL